MTSSAAKLLFEDLSPGAADIYERRTRPNGGLFAESSVPSYVDIRFKYVDSYDATTNRGSSRAREEPIQTAVTGQKWAGWKRGKIEVLAELKKVLDGKGPVERIFIFSLENSWSVIRSSLDLFTVVIDRFHVFAKFREFALSFGRMTSETQVGPPPIRFKPFILPESNQIGLDLAPETAVFEMAYGLRFVELNERSEKEPWSLRQSAIYHKYYLDGTSTRILISPSIPAFRRLEEYYQGCPDIQQSDPLEMHALLIDSSLSNWRAYMIWLAEQTDEQTTTYQVFSHEARYVVNIDLSEQKMLKKLEDHVLDIFVSIDSTIDTIDRLLAQSESISNRNTSGQAHNRKRVAVIALEEQRREATLIMKRAKVLHRKVNGITQLMSSLLDLENGNALKDLAVKSREESETMRQLSEKGIRDAAAVKTLTVIMLIYLPSSAVANIFSTHLIQDQPSASSNNTDPAHIPASSFRMTAASNMWVYWAIAVPLTIITVLAWWLWVHREEIAEDFQDRQRRNGGRWWRPNFPFGARRRARDKGGSDEEKGGGEGLQEKAEFFEKGHG